MERQPTTPLNENATAGGWDAWDAAPRDGPAVFVIDASRLDTSGDLRGGWLDPTVDTATFTRGIADLLGREPNTGEWAIIDQTGLGETMLPETFNLAELGDVLAETHESQP